MCQFSPLPGSLNLGTMYQIKIIRIFQILGLVLPSCITPYEPRIESKDINKYVVSGQVTDETELQTVSISMACLLYTSDAADE